MATTMMHQSVRMKKLYNEENHDIKFGMTATKSAPTRALVGIKNDQQKKDQAPLCPHKKTDFRYQLWLKERKALKETARKNSFRVESKGNPMPKNAVTVDTSKARSIIDVVRLCLQELGYKEVIAMSYISDILT